MNLRRMEQVEALVRVGIAVVLCVGIGIFIGWALRAAVVR